MKWKSFLKQLGKKKETEKQRIVIFFFLSVFFINKEHSVVPYQAVLPYLILLKGMILISFFLFFFPKYDKLIRMSITC